MPENARVSLLDLLRADLHLTGTTVGCNQGACGACMVLLNCQRVRSCFTLAAQVGGSRVTTIQGLAEGDRLHPLQGAFIEYGGFRCGNCTPDQICATSAMLRELAEGMPSYVIADRAEESIALS